MFQEHQHKPSRVISFGLERSVREAIQSGDTNEALRLFEEDPRLACGVSVDGVTTVHLAVRHLPQLLPRLLASIHEQLGSYDATTFISTIGRGNAGDFLCNSSPFTLACELKKHDVVLLLARNGGVSASEILKDDTDQIALAQEYNGSLFSVVNAALNCSQHRGNRTSIEFNLAICVRDELVRAIPKLFELDRSLAKGMGASIRARTRLVGGVTGEVDCYTSLLKTSAGVDVVQSFCDAYLKTGSIFGRNSIGQRTEELRPEFCEEFLKSWRSCSEGADLSATSARF